MSNELEVLDREAEEIINDIGIPPCPAILTTLMREMREDEPDFVKLGKLIGSDVSLAAAMLKTVNSPFYGLRSKATSVQQAITLLGLRNVAQIVTGLLFVDPAAQDMHDSLGTIDRPLNALTDAELTPGARPLEALNKSLR